MQQKNNVIKVLRAGALELWPKQSSEARHQLERMIGGTVAFRQAHSVYKVEYE